MKLPTYRCKKCQKWCSNTNRAKMQLCFTCEPAKSRRKHAPPKVGDDMGGGRVIIAVLGKSERSNEVVRIRCARGHEADRVMHNLRASKNCQECYLEKLRAKGDASAVREMIAELSKLEAL